MTKSGKVKKGVWILLQDSVLCCCCLKCKASRVFFYNLKSFRFILLIIHPLTWSILQMKVHAFVILQRFRHQHLATDPLLVMLTSSSSVNTELKIWDAFLKGRTSLDFSPTNSSPLYSPSSPSASPSLRPLRTAYAWGCRAKAAARVGAWAGLGCTQCKAAGDWPSSEGKRSLIV